MQLQGVASKLQQDPSKNKVKVYTRKKVSFRMHRTLVRSNSVWDTWLRYFMLTFLHSSDHMIVNMALFILNKLVPKTAYFLKLVYVCFLFLFLFFSNLYGWVLTFLGGYCNKPCLLTESWVSVGWIFAPVPRLQRFLYILWICWWYNKL